MNDRELDLALQAMGRDRIAVAEPPTLRERVSMVPLARGGHSRWLPRPGTGGYTMFSALRFVVAAGIVALSGGFLLSGVLTTPSTEEVPPAALTDSPTPTSTPATTAAPTTTEEPAFPTGTFVAEEDGPTLEFRTDGTCERAGVACTFGVIGGFFTEMTFEDPSGVQVPATYRWDFDGESLTFETYGVDKRPERQGVYADHVYRPAGETLPLPDIPTDFPMGWFVPADGRTNPRLLFWEDGSFRSNVLSGKFVVNGDLWTDVRNNSAIVEKVPGTYRWRWEKEELTFEVWGEDDNAFRTGDLAHTFIRDETESEFVGKRTLLLSHPQLDVWAKVEVVERDDGSLIATATDDGEPLGEGVGETLEEAVRAALEPLGEPYASEMAQSVGS